MFNKRLNAGAYLVATKFASNDNQIKLNSKGLSLHLNL